VSFTQSGWLAFFPVIFSFALIPLLEYAIGEDPTNLGKAEEELVRRDRVYDIILYLTVPIQVAVLVWFVWIMKEGGMDAWTRAGRIASTGIMCGVFGINIAHELGHRSLKGERFLAKIMLCTSLYLHFYIEHNRGHHRNVGTPEDPATANRGEMLYTFWLRSLTGGFRSAWNIVKKERLRKNQAVWSFGNEMIQYLVVQGVIVAIIGWVGGWPALSAFLIAAFAGMLLLETVNYIEHYGLQRKRVSEHRFEDVEPWHSWNSDFILGRLMLFELTRHSDHHWEPSKHYEVLESMPKALQLPAGYPAMMLLSLAPPVWFKVMDKRLEKVD